MGSGDRGGGPPRRRRVEQLLERRWEQRTLLIAGPAGAGKSTALRRAVEANHERPQGIDILLTVDPVAGYAGLIAELGARTGIPDADTAEIIDWMVGQSPRQIAILIDDIHKLHPPAELLEFSTRLPANSHLVLSGRGVATMPGATLIDEGALAFDESELVELADAVGVDPATLHGLDGWPAGVDLAAMNGAAATGRLVAENLLQHLDPVERRAVEIVAVLGAADDSLLTELGVDGTALELTRRLPLMRLDRDQVAAHDLVRDAVADLAGADEIRRQAAVALIARGEEERAAGLLADTGDWPAALDRLATTAIGGLTARGHAVARHWLERVPADHLDHPTIGLFEAAIARRQDPALPSVRVVLDEATAKFRERGHTDGELAGLTMLGYIHARVTGDLLALAAVHARVVEIHEAGHTGAVGLARLGDAVISHVGGDPAEAVRRLDALPRQTLTPEWQGIADWYHTMALLDLGRPRDALALRTRPRDDERVPMEEALHGATWSRWAAGEVREIATEVTADLEHASRRLPRERVDAGLYAVGFCSATGDLESARRAEQLVIEHAGPDDVAIHNNLLVSQAMLAVGEGDEDRARDLMETRLPERLTGVGERRAVIRLLPIPYVTSPRLRERIAAEDWPGCWRTAVDLANLLVRSRAGDRPEWRETDWEDPGHLVAHLGLRWALELTGHAHADGAAGARESCARMLEWFPDASLRILDEMRAGEGRAAKGAASLLAELPAPPPQATHVLLLGPAEMRRGSEEVHDKDWRRERVRALLSLLVMHRKVTREKAATWLWPDLEPDRALGNLRTTLNYLQRVIEPDRPRKAAAWSIRSERQVLRLVDDDYLRVDVWEFDALNAEAEAIERRGEPGAALEYRLAAIDRWRGDPFTEVMYEEWALAECDRLRLALLRQLVRAAELLSALDRSAEAIELANRALALEPGAENAARALVAAHLARDDIGSARAAYRSALASIDEMGFAPEAATVELGRRLGVV